MSVIHSAHRFLAKGIDTRCPYQFVSDRCLDIRVTFFPSRETVLLSECDKARADRVMAFIRGAMIEAPGAAYCWGIEVSGGSARMLYDAGYIASFRGVDEPPRRVMARDGIELLGISFHEAPTPDECLDVCFQ